VKKPKHSDTAAFAAALHATQTKGKQKAVGQRVGKPTAGARNTLSGARALKPDSKGGAQPPKSPPPKPRKRK